MCSSRRFTAGRRQPFNDLVQRATSRLGQRIRILNLGIQPPYLVERPKNQSNSRGPCDKNTFNMSGSGYDAVVDVDDEVRDSPSITSIEAVASSCE